jgi:hypothetical protein
MSGHFANGTALALFSPIFAGSGGGEAGGVSGGRVVDCGAQWSKVGDYNLGEGGLVPHVSRYLRAPPR